MWQLMLVGVASTCFVPENFVLQLERNAVHCIAQDSSACVAFMDSSVELHGCMSHLEAKNGSHMECASVVMRPRPPDALQVQWGNITCTCRRSLSCVIDALPYWKRPWAWAGWDFFFSFSFFVVATLTGGAIAQLMQPP